jgi:hypothetical protein
VAAVCGRQRQAQWQSVRQRPAWRCGWRGGDWCGDSGDTGGDGSSSGGGHGGGGWYGGGVVPAATVVCDGGNCCVCVCVCREERARARGCVMRACACAGAGWVRIAATHLRAPPAQQRATLLAMARRTARYWQWAWWLQPITKLPEISARRGH